MTEQYGHPLTCTQDTDEESCADRDCPVHYCPRFTWALGSGCGRPARFCICP